MLIVFELCTEGEGIQDQRRRDLEQTSGTLQSLLSIVLSSLKWMVWKPFRVRVGLEGKNKNEISAYQCYVCRTNNN